MTQTTDESEPLEPQDLLTEIVLALVDHHQQVRVEEQDGGGNVSMFLVHCHPDDRGKVIGKGGKTIMALRHLLSCTLAPRRRRAEVEVADSKAQSRAA
jgi:hypothetical protein